MTDNDDRHRCTYIKVGERSPKRQGKKKDALFLRSSGFPFFTDATTMSPTPASGRRFRCEPKPKGSMRYSDFAPLLSAQLRTAPTGRPRVRRNLFPEDPAPVNTKENEEVPPGMLWGNDAPRLDILLVDTVVGHSFLGFCRFVVVDNLVTWWRQSYIVYRDLPFSPFWQSSYSSRLVLY